ncbi:hypothetical protein J437_LFUL007600 [Ladona fulva]|uniref:THAP-type domain-containing protein n=1 Tax=Ladona fulva TaxID=123851 RepID=A0A8K0K633_LADFU|nr:hypothetical protein J437_LFUL007600 [Ladona fulva]
MAWVCWVEGCYSNTKTKGMELFHFPGPRDICSKWVKFTASSTLSDYWEKRQLTGKRIGSNYKICRLHFRDEDFVNEWKVKLRRGVVPSQNGPPKKEFKARPKTSIYSTPISSSCSFINKPTLNKSCAIEVGDTELADLEDPCLPINRLKSIKSFDKSELQTHLDSYSLRSAHESTPSFSKRVCLVEGCCSTTKINGVRLFCFPTNKEICLKWVEFTGSLRLLDAWEKGVTLPMNSRICSYHFCDEDYESDRKIKLKDDIIPSLNGPPEIKIEVESEIDNVSCSSPNSPLPLNCNSTGNPSFDTSSASDIKLAAFSDLLVPSSQLFQNNGATSLNSDLVISTCGTNVCKIERVFSVGCCELLKLLMSD